MPAMHPILVAEDEKDDVLLLERAFRKAKIANPFVTVQNGEEAVAYLSGRGRFADRGKYPLPILLLLDLKMPRLNGFELISWVRQESSVRGLPLIVLTSSKQNPDITRAYELGASTYLVKPVQFSGLVEMLGHLHNFWLVLAELPGYAETNPPSAT